MKTTVIVLAIMGGVLGMAVAIPACWALNWTSRAAQVVSEQVDPAELLRKYEWFKDAAAALGKKQADIRVYEGRFKALSAEYQGQPRNAWSREDREQWNLWQSEVAGIKASYNSLAADYNAQMSKINWRFTNRGDLPKGATDPLPREFAPFQEQ